MRLDTKTAFHWIIYILKELNVPFQITGGLAAIAYGASRPLKDIDIDIPEECFLLVQEKVTDFIIYGPDHFKDEAWDLRLMTLNYYGQIIDLGGAFNTKLFNKNTQKWQECRTDYSTSETIKCFDLDVSVISKDNLIFYKKILSRRVDLIDVAQIEIKNARDP